MEDAAGRIVTVRKNSPYRDRSEPDRHARRRANKRAAREGLTELELDAIDALYERAELKSLATGESWQVDHIVPLNRGGRHHVDNMAIISERVNKAKRDKLLSECDEWVQREYLLG